MRAKHTLFLTFLLLLSGCVERNLERAVRPVGSSMPERVSASGQLELVLKVPAALSQGGNTIVSQLKNVSRGAVSLPLWCKPETEPNFLVYLRRISDGQVFPCSRKHLRNVAVFETRIIAPGEVDELRGEFVISAPPGRYILFSELAPCSDVVSNEILVEILPNAGWQEPSKSI
jgi:hypothetical protein